MADQMKMPGLLHGHDHMTNGLQVSVCSLTVKPQRFSHKDFLTLSESPYAKSVNFHITVQYSKSFLSKFILGFDVKYIQVMNFSSHMNVKTNGTVQLEC